METTTILPKTNEKHPDNKSGHVTPEHIMQIGTGFWASKTLLAAINFKLFTVLAKGPLSASQIKSKLTLHERSLYDFLDTLTALGFLQRKGTGATAIYSNSPDTDLFLDKDKPSYMGGILEMCNNRLYRYWGDLEEALITGKQQNEAKYSNADNQFAAIYSNPETLKEFINAMTGIQMGAFMAFAKAFNFSKYHTLLDVGGSGAALSIQVAMDNKHINCISLDLKKVEPMAKANIKKHNLTARIETKVGDFFKEALPKADVVVMGNILHDWNEEEKLALIKKAYDALPAGGAFICIENIIDNDRNKNVFALLMSLNMLIETKGGFDFTFNDFTGWANKTGFKKTELIPLVGPASAAVAYK